MSRGDGTLSSAPARDARTPVVAAVSGRDRRRPFNGVRTAARGPWHGACALANMCERILRIEKAAQLADRVLPLTQRPTTMRVEVIVDCARLRVPDASGDLASRDLSSLMGADVHGGSA